MKVLLNCDDVFESLTCQCAAAGDETALQEHLETCSHCRELADSLAPALNLFQGVDAVPSAEERCAGLVASVALANRVWRQVEAQQHEVVRDAQSRSFLSLGMHAWSQLGAAAAILIALGGLFWAASPSGRAPRQDFAALPAFASPLVRATQPTEHGLLHLTSLQLQETCLSRGAASRDAAAFQCCTRCHQAGDILPAMRLVAFSQQSCVACHKS